jgi:hypothetical protein
MLSCCPLPAVRFPKTHGRIDWMGFQAFDPRSKLWSAVPPLPVVPSPPSNRKSASHAPSRPPECPSPQCGGEGCAAELPKEARRCGLGALVCADVCLIDRFFFFWLASLQCLAWLLGSLGVLRGRRRRRVVRSRWRGQRREHCVCLQIRRPELEVGGAAAARSPSLVRRRLLAVKCPCTPLRSAPTAGGVQVEFKFAAGARGSSTLAATAQGDRARSGPWPPHPG